MSAKKATKGADMSDTALAQEKKRAVPRHQPHYPPNGHVRLQDFDERLQLLSGCSN
jgi:hypothetical protein